jgi:glucose-1-phosphate cytidylyltransferase
MSPLAIARQDMSMALPPVIILCGGRGTRLQERTADLPKPLVEIGDKPIVWHVIQLYVVQGAREFILAGGYKSDQLAEFVASEPWPEGVRVRCVDTGVDTETGGRIHLLRREVDGDTFMVTYADGVADIDLAALLDHHRAHGQAATVTVVRPELQFGVAEIGEGDVVSGFHEKPRADHWINGGFFCFEPAVFDYLSASAVLEREPLEGLADDRALHAFRHTGFWACMDTYKDATRLNDLWASGEAPWKLW